MDRANQAFGNADALQRALTQQQRGQIQGQAQDARAGLGDAIAGASTLAQQRGMNFRGFNPAEQARLYGGAEGAVAGMEADANLAGTQLGGVLVGLQGARREAGRGFQDSQRDRRQERQIDERERTAAERQARQRGETQVQAAQIREQRRQAEAAAREAQRQQEAQLQRRDDLVEAMIEDIEDPRSRLRGRDGYISPSAMQSFARLWTNEGYDLSDFPQSQFRRFFNPSHEEDYMVGTIEDWKRLHGGR